MPSCSKLSNKGDRTNRSYRHHGQKKEKLDINLKPNAEFDAHKVGHFINCYNIMKLLTKNLNYKDTQPKRVSLLAKKDPEFIHLLEMILEKEQEHRREGKATCLEVFEDSIERNFATHLDRDKKRHIHTCIRTAMDITETLVRTSIYLPEDHILEGLSPKNPEDLEKLDKIFWNTFLDSEIMRFHGNWCKNIHFWLK